MNLYREFIMSKKGRQILWFMALCTRVAIIFMDAISFSRNENVQNQETTVVSYAHNSADDELPWDEIKVILNETKWSEESKKDSSATASEWQMHPEPENYKFNIPSTTWEMNQLKEILNNNPWEIKVQIWLFEKSVSPEWLEKLKNLLTK